MDSLMNRPKWLLVLEFLAAFTGILGMALISFGYPLFGLIVSIIASCLFIVYNLKTKQYSMLMMSLVYLTVEIIGIFVWRNN